MQIPKASWKIPEKNLTNVMDIYFAEKRNVCGIFYQPELKSFKEVISCFNKYPTNYNILWSIVGKLMVFWKVDSHGTGLEKLLIKRPICTNSYNYTVVLSVYPLKMFNGYNMHNTACSGFFALVKAYDVVENSPVFMEFDRGFVWESFLQKQKHN